MRVHPVSCFHYQRLALTVRNSVPEQFELCLNTFRRVKDSWPQPTGRGLTNQSTASSWVAPSWLGPVGPFHLWSVVARLHLCIGKWRLVPFSHCKGGAIAQTGDNVASECHMHWALQ